MLTPSEYDQLLGKYIVLGKAVELIQTAIEDGIRTLTSMKPTGIASEVPPGTPVPEKPATVKVTKTLGGRTREKVIDPDEAAKQATAPARDYISPEQGGQGAADSAPPPRASGSRINKKKS